MWLIGSLTLTLLSFVRHPFTGSNPLFSTLSINCKSLSITSEEAGILEDIRKDIRDQLGLLKKAREKGRRYHIRTEIKTLRKELKER